ncbi:MAG: HTTM domain-containing protein [Patiriisocius sp.]
MKSSYNRYITKQTKAAPLAVFRILFGFMMLASIIRFWSFGWIETLYIEPIFSFSYYGFHWLPNLGQFTYLLFIICGVSAFSVAIGYRYRLAIVLFFLSFTYIELLDKTTYLNHYYFISCLSFLLIFLPANCYYSLDALRLKNIRANTIPAWSINSIKLLLCIVYFFAGLAKLNSDWLLNAMPLQIWLPSKYDIPFLGDLLQQSWIHYAFSWGGAFYDLAIPFLLLWKPSRSIAFIFVVIFHVLTRILFPIGMFPYIMIVSALIFFDATFHERILSFFSWLLKKIRLFRVVKVNDLQKEKSAKIASYVVALFIVVQLLLPWRYALYPKDLFLTEEGYRFSWRVMLMEKAGYAQFIVKNTKTGSQFAVNNSDFLTPFQEKQMSTQPDFILEYAHYLGAHFKSQGHQNIAVHVESYVALNGRLSQPFISPEVNLLDLEDTFMHKDWILEFNDTIQGI